MLSLHKKFINKIKKRNKLQLREQKLDRINIRGVPDDSRIRSENQKRKR
jgi:hypothetical protein